MNSQQPPVQQPQVVGQLNPQMNSYPQQMQQGQLNQMTHGGYGAPMHSNPNMMQQQVGIYFFEAYSTFSSIQYFFRKFFSKYKLFF